MHTESVQVFLQKKKKKSKLLFLRQGYNGDWKRAQEKNQLCGVKFIYDDDFSWTATSNIGLAFAFLPCSDLIIYIGNKIP